VPSDTRRRTVCQARISRLGIAHEEGADTGLGGESLGELSLGDHGRLEIVESVLLHKEHVRQVAERGHAEPIRSLELRTKRGDGDVCGCGEGLGEIFVQGLGDPPAPRQQCEVVEARHAVLDEATLRKGGIDPMEIGRDDANDPFAKEVLERLGHGQKAGSDVTWTPASRPFRFG